MASTPAESDDRRDDTVLQQIAAPAHRPVRQALDTILDGHLPYPAIVVRPHGILVTANRAFDVFNEGGDPALLAPPANMFRPALHTDGLAPRVHNLPERGRHITKHLRACSYRAPPMGVTIDDARAIVAPLPRSYEALVHDRVKFRVGRIVYAAFSRDETIMGFGFPKEEREALVDSEPDKFLMPRPSDMRYRWVCVRLDAIDVDELRELLIDAWRMCVPKKVAAAYEG